MWVISSLVSDKTHDALHEVTRVGPLTRLELRAEEYLDILVDGGDFEGALTRHYLVELGPISLLNKRVLFVPGARHLIHNADRVRQLGHDHGLEIIEERLILCFVMARVPLMFIAVGTYLKNERMLPFCLL